MITHDQIDAYNSELQQADFEEVMQSVNELFDGRLVMTSSFQTQSIPLLHMISRLDFEVPILFLDTGFHFKETLAFRDDLLERWGLNVLNVSKTLGHSEFLRIYGPLYKKNVDKCCHINKTIPLRSVVEHYSAWISGVRSDQTSLRQKLRLFNLQKDGKVKVCPMINWTERDVFKYMAEHKLPEHPLLSKGYMSVGCKPCTSPVYGDSESRSGRWQGESKTECGIHKEE
ncbi:MAG: phosphoadenylyl-sulfate reductase [Roseivirga sp.]|nr:phosphoadenylyl-sulfate reductase [Roseivirga sp.]